MDKPTDLTCPKCNSSFLTPMYNWFLNKLWMQCKCGWGTMVEPMDNREETK